MQEPKEIRDYDTVLSQDERPARRDGTCFYCSRSLGEKHKDNCVIRENAGFYHVAIRHNPTGEIRQYRYDFTFNRKAADYQWTEGNLSCDCNLHADFARANGAGPEGDENWNSLLGVLPCDGREYTVMYATLPDGTKHGLMEPLQ